jgi:hypothetical protein
MAIVARMNLAAAPFAPVMRQAEEMFYRNGPFDLRRAILGGVDVLLTNALGMGGGTPGQNMVIANADFVCCSDASLQARINFWQISTSTLTTLVLAASANGYLGTVHVLDRGGGIRHICTGKSEFPGLNNGYQVWTPLPPAQADNAAQTNPNTFPYLITEGNYGGVSLLNFGGSGTAGNLALFAAPPNNIVPTVLAFPGTIGANALGYTIQDICIPWFFKEDAVYIYGFARDLITNQPVIQRHNKTTGAVNQSYLSAVPIGGAPAANFVNAFDLNTQFNRIYWAFDDNKFRLFGANTDPWPPVAIDTIDVDVNLGIANSIRSIDVFPPYIYLTKTTGTNFGNQFIKIYDSALENPRRRRHRGGEMWGIIPEVANYLG